MNCGKCGGVVEAGGKFCRQCGSPVAAAPVEPPPLTRLASTDPVPGETTRYCMTCGGAVAANQSKCDACGTALVAPAASGPPKTRLAEPIEASYEALGSAPTAPTPTRMQTAPAGRPPRSNRTFYQLLGVAFLLIACGYVGYHYLSAPPAPETRRAEHLELLAGQPAPAASGGSWKGRPNDEYAAQSPPPLAAGRQTGAVGAAPSDTMSDSTGSAADPRAGAPDRPVEPLRGTPAPREYKQPAPSRLASPAAPPPTRYANPPPKIPRDATPAAEARTPGNAVSSPPRPLAVESPTPAAPPRSSAPVDPFPTQSSPAKTEKAPPERGGKVLLPGSEAWRPPSTKSAPARPPRQTASASPPPRLQPRPPAPAPQPKGEGIIYWTGQLKKNQTIVIDGTEATVGFADGDLLPGKAVDVHIPSPAVALAERPTPRNGWKRVAFRCLRSTKRPVTLNIQWRTRQ